MTKITKTVKRRRMQAEIPTARVAIRNHCLECCGYSWKKVKQCTARACWLFPWRLGKTPLEIKKRTGRVLTAEEIGAMIKARRQRVHTLNSAAE